MQPFAKLPAPPCYAVIFSSQRTPHDNGYNRMSEHMAAVASRQSGFLGMETARGEDGFGITVSYWESLETIAAWKAQSEHRAAQDMGKALWYQYYELRIARIERAYAKRTCEHVIEC